MGCSRDSGSASSSTAATPTTASDPHRRGRRQRRRLGVGAALWPRRVPEGSEVGLIAGLSVLGGWNGAWLPALGHASAEDVDQATAGGIGWRGRRRARRDRVRPAPRGRWRLPARRRRDGRRLHRGRRRPRRAAERALRRPGLGPRRRRRGRPRARRRAARQDSSLSAVDPPLLVLAPIEGLWLGAWFPISFTRRSPSAIASARWPPGASGRPGSRRSPARR